MAAMHALRTVDQLRERQLDERDDIVDCHRSSSTISKSSVICAILPSMMDAEQYFSCDRRMACSTRLRLRARPRTTKCMWMLVKIFGSTSARCDVSLTSQPVTCCPLFLRITTTS